MSLRLFSLTNRRSSRCAGSNPRISGCQVRNGKAPALHFRPQSVMAAGESLRVLSINRVGTAL
ncbi:hypothetical protein CRI69_15050 [Escherichia sp. E4742]|nr:hypothetical protein CRI69_15050 [Escherichia sp. E4742]